MDGRDRVLMVAYTVYSDQLCPNCGYPRSLCRAAERFKVKEEYCFASAAVEKARKEDSRDDDFGLIRIPEYQPPVEL